LSTLEDIEEVGQIIADAVRQIPPFKNRNAVLKRRREKQEKKSELGMTAKGLEGKIAYGSLDAPDARSKNYSESKADIFKRNEYQRTSAIINQQGGKDNLAVAKALDKQMEWHSIFHAFEELPNNEIMAIAYTAEGKPFYKDLVSVNYEHQQEENSAAHAIFLRIADAKSDEVVLAGETDTVKASFTIANKIYPRIDLKLNDQKTEITIVLPESEDIAAEVGGYGRDPAPPRLPDADRIADDAAKYPEISKTGEAVKLEATPVAKAVEAEVEINKGETTAK